MLYWIEMDVMNMVFEIVFIPNNVIPKSLLPKL